ncbi:hypothetical protein PSJE_20845 [Pseudomonas jessenii]|nr:hypothetical protein PSJE_20845 [Pseudomonas jessenii]
MGRATSCRLNQNPVGASLLAMRLAHSTLMATDTPPSRASSLPQGTQCLAGLHPSAECCSSQE